MGILKDHGSRKFPKIESWIAPGSKVSNNGLHWFLDSCLCLYIDYNNQRAELKRFSGRIHDSWSIACVRDKFLRPIYPVYLSRSIWLNPHENSTVSEIKAMAAGKQPSTGWGHCYFMRGHNPIMPAGRPAASRMECKESRKRKWTGGVGGKSWIDLQLPNCNKRARTWTNLGESAFRSCLTPWETDLVQKVQNQSKGLRLA